MEFYAGSSHIGAFGATTVAVLKNPVMFPLKEDAKVAAFSSDIDNGGASHLIKNSYRFNNHCIAQHQCIVLFIDACCCRGNNVCY